ncbi:MAG TPA: hypothetical protein VII50_11685 [Acidothermaceae bacterium]
MEVVALADRPDLHHAIDAMPKSWPTFMYKDPAARLMSRLPSTFPQLQFAALDGDEVVGIVIAASFAWDGDLTSLPDRGWDAILEQVIRDEDEGRMPTASPCSKLPFTRPARRRLECLAADRRPRSLRGPRVRIPLRAGPAESQITRADGTDRRLRGAPAPRRVAVRSVAARTSDSRRTS